MARSSSFILRRSSFPRRSRAFSLIEILVVIGILVVLIGLTAMYLAKARRQAARTRQAHDFQAIQTALDMFKADHGDYPRPFGTGTGFATLGQALIGPGPKTHVTGDAPSFSSGSAYEGGEIVDNSGTLYLSTRHNDTGTTPAPVSDDWIAISNWADNADGPGFKLRSSGGQTFGPYLQADKFKVRGFAILDLWGNPILYFPSRAGAININKPTPVPPGLGPTFAWDTRDTSTYPQLKPLFDVTDNLGMLGGKSTALPSDTANVAARQALQKMLGDNDMDGWIGQGESANTTGPCVLWSAGPDAEGNHEFVYGLINAAGQRDLTATGKTDDVTNFDLPIGLLKK